MAFSLRTPYSIHVREMKVSSDVCLAGQVRILAHGNALDDLEILKISVHVLQGLTDQSLLFIGLKIGDLMGFLSMFFYTSYIV